MLSEYIASSCTVINFVFKVALYKLSTGMYGFKQLRKQFYFLEWWFGAYDNAITTSK